VGVPSPLGRGLGGAMPPPQKIFSILDLKMATLGAFLALFFFTVHAGAEGVWVGFLMFGLEIVYYGAL